MYKVYVLNFKTNLGKMLTLPSWQWPCRMATYLFFLLRTSCLPLPPLWFQYSLPGKDHAPGCSQPVNERGGSREIVRGCFGRNVNHLKHSPYIKPPCQPSWACLRAAQKSEVLLNQPLPHLHFSSFLSLCYGVTFIGVTSASDFFCSLIPHRIPAQ